MPLEEFQPTDLVYCLDHKAKKTYYIPNTSHRITQHPQAGLS